MRTRCPNNRYIIPEGEAIPPPIKSFKDMRFPDPLRAALEKNGIKRPTPIQVYFVEQTEVLFS